MLPFLLVSQKVFASSEEERISLGELQQVCHAFGEVFAAFSMVGGNWSAVNDFRATLRRLHRFESLLTSTGPRSCQASRGDGVEVEMRLADAAAVVTVVEDEQITPEKLEEVDRSKTR